MCNSTDSFKEVQNFASEEGTELSSKAKLQENVWPQGIETEGWEKIMQLGTSWLRFNTVWAIKLLMKWEGMQHRDRENNFWLEIM